LIKLRKDLAGIEAIDQIQKNAMDINNDRTTSITDLIKVRKYLAGIEVW